MNNKLKVGDKVKVLDGSNVVDYCGGWMSESIDNMDKYINTEHIISKINGKNIEFEDNYWMWDARYLELIEKSLNITINVTNNKTILSDGKNEVEVIRYAKDEHSNKIATEEVIKKYFKTIEEINIGDTVCVTDIGKVYDTYGSWLLDNKVSLQSAIKWICGLLPIENTNIEYEVVQVGIDGKIFIENHINSFLIGKNGLMKV